MCAPTKSDQKNPLPSSFLPPSLCPDPKNRGPRPRRRAPPTHPCPPCTRRIPLAAPPSPAASRCARPSGPSLQTRTPDAAARPLSRRRSRAATPRTGRQCPPRRPQRHTRRRARRHQRRPAPTPRWGWWPTRLSQRRRPSAPQTRTGGGTPWGATAAATHTDGGGGERDSWAWGGGRGEGCRGVTTTTASFASPAPETGCAGGRRTGLPGADPLSSIVPPTLLTSPGRSKRTGQHPSPAHVSGCAFLARLWYRPGGWVAPQEAHLRCKMTLAAIPPRLARCIMRAGAAVWRPSPPHYTQSSQLYPRDAPAPRGRDGKLDATGCLEAGPATPTNSTARMGRTSCFLRRAQACAFSVKRTWSWKCCGTARNAPARGEVSAIADDVARTTGWIGP